MDEDKTLNLDRRRYSRLEDSVFILGNLRSNPTEKFKASMQNISAAGLMFEAERDISQDTTLGLEIYQPIDRHNNMSFSIVVLARVAWIREIEKNNFEEGGNKYKIGVEFLKIKEKDRNRIAEYVEEGKKTGVDLIRNVPWGTHLCQFYKAKEDLMDILVPYFKAGLENNEFCLWVTSEPVSEEEAANAVRKVVPDFDRYLKNGHMEIFPHSEWYLKDGVFNSQRVLNAWIDKLNQAHSKGFNGMRVTGNTAWLEKRDWKDFTNYEEEINKAIGKYRMSAICSYSLNKCGVSEVVDIISNHQFALIRREDKWEFIESHERKKAKEELMASEKKFKDLIETTPDWVWETDRDGVYTYISPRVKDLLGYEVNDVLGKTPFDLMPKEEGQRIGKIFNEKVIKKEPFYNLENINRHKNGHLVVLETNGIPIFDKEGQLKGYRGIDRDITERKKMEEALRESEVMYKALFTGAPEGILVADLQTKQFRYANSAICRMFGYTEEEFTRLCIADIHPKESLSYVLAEFEAQVRGEKLLTSDIPCLCKDGTLFYANISGNEIVLNGRKCNVGFFTDITELKQAEKMLRESELRLRDQNLALEQKNLALKEMIEHIERTRNKTKEDIAINVDKTLMPIVGKLRIKGVSPKYIKLLKHHLKNLSSSFGRKITQKSAKLTSREIEICNMIKGGLASKDIAGLLNLSRQTIEKHRKNIRKKLGLSRKVNLSFYLQHF